MSNPKIVSVLLIAIFAVSCVKREYSLSPFDESVGALIQKQCNFETECRIRISDATEFDWDEMYVLRAGLLDVEAKEVLPQVGELWGEFNRKIVFLKNGKRIHADETAEIIEGEHTPPGMLFFESGDGGNADIYRYSSQAEFIVTRKTWVRGFMYDMHCTNCYKSPVFAEFGTARQNTQRGS